MDLVFGRHLNSIQLLTKAQQISIMAIEYMLGANLSLIISLNNVSNCFNFSHNRKNFLYFLSLSLSHTLSFPMESIFFFEKKKHLIFLVSVFNQIGIKIIFVNAIYLSVEHNIIQLSNIFSEVCRIQIGSWSSNKSHMLLISWKTC